MADLPHEAAIDRFWDRLVPTASGCWIWDGNVNDGGYGLYAVRSGKIVKTWLVHKLAYYLHHGEEVPSGLVVRHTCDTRRCGNPHHLLTGTQSENLKDRHRSLAA